ncbi:conserved protein of unknown function [Bradyrhizobium vignae]|uniref:Uncharacterized protein n=1 Tax=Bradyrhizobium vignae TaxID=1549949 RepID=A0A2U3Q0R4_9BRAD|nr:conserved protein of unknown function [Bradyrhizobium vignae]
MFARVGPVALKQVSPRCRRLKSDGMSNPATNEQWLPIQIAPGECDLELGRLHKTGIVPWPFPCRRKGGVWFNVWADEPMLISPSHWRIGRSVV